MPSEMTWSAGSLASLPAKERRKFLETLTDDELRFLQYDWDFWARDKQRLPARDFFVWLILAGRGFGKTRTGAETVRIWTRSNKYVNLIGPTSSDARDVMIEGESGLLAICPNDERPQYKKSESKLVWPNGAISLIFTADEPDRLRGKQHMKLWMDEIAAWRYAEQAYDQAMMGLRLGENPQAIVTTTPRPTPIVKSLIVNEKNVITVGTTYENKANLAYGFYSYVIRKYEGTRLGRQELMAEILTDVAGALWQRDKIEELRVIRAPNLQNVIVAVDPPATSYGAEAGIVTAGRNGKSFYVLSDNSLHGTPKEWASAAIVAFYKNNANLIVAEANNGGEMVKATIQNVDSTVPVELVHASRGKFTRAEPVSALYEQNRVHHVGSFPVLEDQMCQWVPGEASPDRMDSLVWAITHLMAGGARLPSEQPKKESRWVASDEEVSGRWRKY